MKKYKMFFMLIFMAMPSCKINQSNPTTIPHQNTQPKKSSHPQFITDKLGITSIPISTIITPHSIKELQYIVRNAEEPIAIAGGRFSQGGHIGYSEGLIIDMQKLNKIIDLNVEKKQITVQAGATWYAVQQYIDPYDLSITAMQSYNNFTVGGSLSVNVHGRDMAYGQIINSVESIQMILADGSLITADRNNHSDLFNAAIGGYGLLGIITQATLNLTDNIALERKIKSCALEHFDAVFCDTIASDPSVVFYNTDILPNDYTKCLITTWHTTNKPVIVAERLQKETSPFYIINKALELFVKRIPLAKLTRYPFERLKEKISMVVWRNYEMSYSTNQLTLDTHFPTTMTLQEYFIPIKNAYTFAKELCSILKNNWVNVLNISIRHVPADTTSILSYAKEESFSFVLYLNIFNLKQSINSSCLWTQEIIDAALKNEGTYYLPYIMCATQEQFDTAYSSFKKLLHIKEIYDPNNKFRNMLLKKYAH